MKNNRYQTGMTLIEIMISLLIGAFLLGGVLQIFLSSKQTYRMQENLSRLQENGRFALDILADDIRTAGYWGCLSPSNPNTDIAGTDNNAAAGDSIDDGTDTITLKGAFVLTPIGVCGTAADAVSSCCKTDPSLTANVCPSLKITICSVAGDPLSTVTYRINNSVLQKTDSTGNYLDLIEGIENMQILYGEDTEMICASKTSTDYAPNYYVTANLVVNMCRVVSIRITLTARTIDGNLTTIGDGRIRRNFTSTLALRNRLQ